VVYGTITFHVNIKADCSNVLINLLNEKLVIPYLIGDPLLAAPIVSLPFN